MSLNLQITNPIDIPNWDEMVLQTDACSIFHSQAWARVLVDTYGYQPAYLTQIENGKLKVLIPLMIVRSWLTGTRAVSLPFSDFCEVTVGGELTFDRIIEQVKTREEFKGCKYFELRANIFGTGDKPHYDTFYSHIIPLGLPAQELIKKFRASTRRNIQTAQKKNVEVTITTDYVNLKKYYHLHSITRKRQGLPPQPIKFFDKIYQHLISRNLAFIILAQWEQTCIAGAIYLHFGKKAVFKFGASLKKYKKLRANNLVMWEAIRYYNEHDYRDINLGRTEMYNQGLLQFKDGWGKSRQVVHYYRYAIPAGKLMNKTYRIQRNNSSLIKGIPLPLLRVAGNLAYKHFG